MNIKTATTEQLQKRLAYLQSTNRASSPEACHIKGKINLRNSAKEFYEWAKFA